MRPAPVEDTGDMREVLSTFFLFCGEAQLFFFFKLRDIFPVTIPMCFCSFSFSFECMQELLWLPISSWNYIFVPFLKKSSEICSLLMDIGLCVKFPFPFLTSGKRKLTRAMTGTTLSLLPELQCGPCALD